MHEFDQETAAVLPDSWDAAAMARLDYFKLFVHPARIADFIKHINNYGLWKMAQHVANRSLDQHTDPRWKEVDVTEMNAFLGLNIYMGIELPRCEHYWSKNRFPANEGFTASMPQNVHEKLQEYSTFLTDSESQEETVLHMTPCIKYDHSIMSVTSSTSCTNFTRTLVLMR